MDERATSCCFTGHRPSHLPWGTSEQDPRCFALKQELDYRLEGIYAAGYRHFIGGMALGCDMLLVAEPALSLELKEAGYLEPVMIPDAASLLRFPYDEEGCWYPVRVCNMVLACNPELEKQWADKGVTIPGTFKDFAADRSLKGLIAMGDPLSSGTTFAAVASLTQSNHYGRQYLKGLAANEARRSAPARSPPP